MACGPFFSRTRAVRMHFNAGAVEPERLDLDAHDPLSLQLFEHAIQHALLRPTIHPCVDRVPVAESRRQAAPLAAVFRHVEDRVEHLQIRQADIPSLLRQ